MSSQNSSDFASVSDPFERGVYEVVSSIPEGRVLTYGIIARLAGWPTYARQVGRLMGHHPASIKLPCHRVVNCNGRLAPGWSEQAKLLIDEGVKVKANGCVDLKSALWKIEDL